jgi:hypothetical protein
LAAQHATREFADRIGGVARSHRSHGKEENQDDGTDDDKLALHRAVGAILSPRAVGLASVILDLIGAKLVVHKTDQSNGVTEELGGGDRGVPESHGGANQQDILQDTAQGHHKGRGLSNLGTC